MSLTSPTGVAIGPQQTARLTIRAEWETIGLIVFGTLGLLLIGAGIFRTIRRRKQPPRSMPPKAWTDPTMIRTRMAR